MERPYKLKRINLESSNNLLGTKLVIEILAIKVTNELSFNIEKYVLKKGRKQCLFNSILFQNEHFIVDS